MHRKERGGSERTLGAVRSNRWLTTLTVLAVTASFIFPTYGQTLQVEWLAGGHASFVGNIAVSPDGQYLVSVSGDGTAKLWSIPENRLLRTLSAGLTVYRAAFSPDNQLVAVAATDGRVRIYRVADGTVQRTLWQSGISSEASAVAYAPDGATVAVGYSNGVIRFWNAQNGALLRTINSAHTDWIRSMAFSPDGQTLVSGSRDRTAKIWNVADGAAIRTLSGHTDYVRSVAIASVNGVLTVASGSDDRTVRLWRASDGALLHTLSGHTGAVYGVVFLPNPLTVASAGGDGTVRLWRVSDGALLRTISAHAGEIYTLAVYNVAGSGAHLATGAQDNRIRTWRTLNGQQVSELTRHIGSVTHVAFAPNNQWVGTGSLDRTAQIWNAATGAPLFTQPFTYTDSVGGVAFSRDSAMFAVGTVRYVYLYSTPAGAQLRRIDAGSSVAFSPVEDLLASTRSSGGVSLWNPNDGTLIRTLGDWVSNLTFSADGRLLAGVNSPQVRIWNVRTGDLVRTLNHSSVSAVAFAPNGLLMATCGYDRTVKLWRVTDGALTQNIISFNHDYTSVAFSRDSRFVIVGTTDGFLRLFRSTDGLPLLAIATEETRSGVTSLAVAPDGQRFVFGRPDAALVVARLPSGFLYADVDGNGCVDDSDLLQVLFEFGSSGEITPADVNFDGTVDDADLLEVLFNFGAGC